MRHAYLIMAHNEFGILRRLIQMIDDERNDIYVHIDRKVRNFDFNAFAALPRKSRLFFTKRIRVHWGHSSLVKCEYILFKAAFHERCDYYHLLSGIDLPLKCQDEIHAFFEQNRGKEFVPFVGKTADALPPPGENILSRVRYYYPLQAWKRSPVRLARDMESRTFPINMRLQHLLRIDRLKHQPLPIFKGSEWISVTDAFVRLLLENERWTKKLCRFSRCSDEIFAQTLLHGSALFANCAFTNMRSIDWQRGSPYTFREEDFDALIHSGCLWARKITEADSGRLPDMLYEHVLGASAPGDPRPASGD